MEILCTQRLILLFSTQVCRGIDKDKVLVEYVTQGIPLVVTSFFKAGNLALTLFKIPVRALQCIYACYIENSEVHKYKTLYNQFLLHLYTCTCMYCVYT